ncbi:MAG: zf-HC2 domain-containing protein [Candidatus Omnitrophica bacterium]|nr:zf-HC2 domain-containing protein [Candidatus Omnitrophota bacterium]
MNKCGKFEEDIILYHYAELSGRDKKAFEEHIVQCEDCRAQLRGVRESLRTVDQMTGPDPSPEFWEDYHTSLNERIRRKPFLLKMFHSWRKGFKVAGVPLFPGFDFRFVSALALTLMITVIVCAVILIKQQQFVERHEKISVPIYAEQKMAYGTEQKVITEELPRKVFKLETGIDMPPEDVAVRVVQQSVADPEDQIEKVTVSPSLKEELILQEMLLLVELGEEVDLPLNDEDLMKDIKMIADFIWI